LPWPNNGNGGGTGRRPALAHCYYYPPNFEEIRAKFGIEENDKVCFCYGHCIYNPFGINISDDLLVHEARHATRQEKIGPETWWRRYLDDPRFRAEEEILAYGAQLRHIRKVNNTKYTEALIYFAKVLSGSIYGHCISQSEAFRGIMLASKV
jgi:hypothetical protein